MKKREGEGFLSEWLTSGRAPDPSRLSRTTIKSDRWDREDYENLLKAMPDFDGSRDRLCDVVDTGNGMTADTFFSFLKIEPETLGEGEIRPDYLVNKVVGDEMRGMREYEELRSCGTVGDDVNSALAFVTMRPDLEAIYDKLKKEQELAEQMQDQMEELNSLDAEGRSLDDVIDGLESMAGDGDADAAFEARDFQAQRDQINQTMADLRDQAAQTAKDFTDGLNGKMPGVRSQLQKGLSKATDEARDMASNAETWGLEPGQLQRMPAEERIALAQRINNPRLKRIADLFGPMRRLMFTEQRRRVNHARDEVHDISKGNELARVLPMQFAPLDDPDTEILFFKDFLEGSLLQYEMRGEERVGKGGIIYCEDGSGSMAGDREMWAKAVGICLMNLARDQKREFKAIHFGSAREIAQFDFVKPEDFNLENILGFAELFFNGGTDFVTPLSLALDHLRQEHEANGSVKGDIVFATDGACGVPPAWLDEFMAEKERLNFEVWGISIGGRYGDEPLNRICGGKVITVKDLISGEDMRGVFGAIGG